MLFGGYGLRSDSGISALVTGVTALAFQLGSSPLT